MLQRGARSHRRDDQDARRQLFRSRHPLQSHSDNSDTIYTLVNGVTGQVEGNVSLETLPSLDALCELNEMSDGEFSQALKAGDLSA